MDAAAKITKAKSLLLLSHPYFGMLASRLTHEPSEKTETFVSDGRVFRYNPDYVFACSIDEIRFVLASSVMHHVLAHKRRKSGRTGWLWQLATDYAINGMLVENGFEIPERVRYDKAYAGMYAEEIYALLKEQVEQGTHESAFDASDEVDGTPPEREVPDEEELRGMSAVPISEEEIDLQGEAEWQYASAMAEEMAKRQSALPSGMERLVEKIVKNRVDWRFELYNAINRHMKNDYAFMPPNKKMISRGIALPSLTSDTLSLCVAVDTSGSINDELLAAFLGEFKAVMESFPAVQIELLIADAKVHAHHTFRSGEKMKFALKGGGGTDFRPVFDYIEGNLPMTTMLLYFTDGDGRFPRYPPNYEVIWALSRSRARVPFGRSIILLD
jgi:predicted metal-dependent peptidase